MHVIVPVAGEGKRFKEAGYYDPKPFIRVAGRRMLEWAFDPIPQDWKIHLVSQKDHLYSLQGWIETSPTVWSDHPGVTLMHVLGLTQGAACTVLAAAVGLPPDEPAAVMNGDQWFRVGELPGFGQGLEALQRQALVENWDGYILSFKANEPRWSYAKSDKEGFVMSVAEKTMISDDATVGFYWFRKAHDLVRGIAWMLANDTRVHGEFYVCPVYNELIFNYRKKIKLVPVEEMWSLGIPEDVKKFEQEKAKELWQREVVTPVPVVHDRVMQEGVGMTDK